jgi:pyrroline-5-carboxylate reductase
MTHAHRLAIVGCGTMGEAIVGGLLRADLVRAERGDRTARRSEVAEALRQRHGVTATSTTSQACAGAEVVLLTLKPQRIAKVLQQPGVREALAGKR